MTRSTGSQKHPRQHTHPALDTLRCIRVAGIAYRWQLGLAQVEPPAWVAPASADEGAQAQQCA
jgi:hypothetical protein